MPSAGHHKTKPFLKHHMFTSGKSLTCGMTVVEEEEKEEATAFRFCLLIPHYQ